jgi:peptidoglycan/LPS O-acetylase OafA/YrhL
MMLVCAYLILQRSAEESFSLPLECGFCLAVGVLLHCFRDSQMQLLNKVVHQIAKYSYGIYLFHCIALWIACFRLANLPEPVQWLLAVALLAVMSVTAFHALEKPAIRIGAQLASTGTPVKANAAPSMTS